MYITKNLCIIIIFCNVSGNISTYKYTIICAEKCVISIYYNGNINKYLKNVTLTF